MESKPSSLHQDQMLGKVLFTIISQSFNDEENQNSIERAQALKRKLEQIRSISRKQNLGDQHEIEALDLASSQTDYKKSCLFNKYESYQPQYTKKKNIPITNNLSQGQQKNEILSQAQQNILREQKQYKKKLRQLSQKQNEYKLKSREVKEIQQFQQQAKVEIDKEQAQKQKDTLDKLMNKEHTIQKKIHRMIVKLTQLAKQSLVGSDIQDTGYEQKSNRDQTAKRQLLFLSSKRAKILIRIAFLLLLFLFITQINIF